MAPTDTSYPVRLGFTPDALAIPDPNHPGLRRAGPRTSAPYGGDSVEVYDVTGKEGRLIKSIKTGKGAHSFRALGDGRHVLVSNRVANTISKIDYQKMEVVDQFPGPSGPDDMDISADGKTILLASRWAKKLTVIDMATRSVVRQISVGKSPHGVWTLDHAPRH